MKTANRILIDTSDFSPSTLEGILAIAGFAAEVNLRKVAEALTQKDLEVFAKAFDRNAKLARLRIEIDDRVALELAQVTVGVRARSRLNLVSKIALIYEKFGAHTVPVARCCSQILGKIQPRHLTDIKKLIEHAVYIADKAVMAFINEDLSWARAAIEQYRAATELHRSIQKDISAWAKTSPEEAATVELLEQTVEEIRSILELAHQMASQVVEFLEAVEI